MTREGTFDLRLDEDWLGVLLLLLLLGVSERADVVGRGGGDLDELSEGVRPGWTGWLERILLGCWST